MSVWVEQVFRSAIARKGGVVRRKLKSIDKYASRDEFLEACAERGYHVIQHRDQWLVFCDRGNVQIIR
jgi:hypothetical protein